MPIIIAIVPELVFFASIFVLKIIGFFTLVEIIIIYFAMFVVLCARTYVKFNFPPNSRDEEERIGIIIAPEESASRYASYFLKKRCDVVKEFSQYTYIGIGTSSLKNSYVHLAVDTSHIAFWGVPSFTRLLSNILIYLRLLWFIFRNKQHVTNVIIYSNPDLIYYLAPLLRKVGPNDMTIITTSVPEKEVARQKIGDQTRKNIHSSDRIILPFLGGKFSDYYSLLKNNGLFNEKKIIQCQAAYVIDYLEKSTIKPSTSYSKKNKTEIIVLLGSRLEEINYHLNVAKQCIETSKRLNLKTVIIASSNDNKDYLYKLFCHHSNLIVVLDDEYDYGNALVAVCKSGTALIKPILFGIPTIPYYIPNIRTHIYIKYFYLKNIDFDPEMFLLPNLIVNRKFNLLTTEFLGSVDVSKLDAAIERYCVSKPNTEDYRIEFAREFLGVHSSKTTYSEIVNEYLSNSKRNLAKLRKEMRIDAQKEKDIIKSYNEEQQDIYDQLLNKGLDNIEILKLFNDHSILPNDSIAVNLAINN